VPRLMFAVSVLVGAVYAEPAAAHPQAAEGPSFEVSECVTVVDKSAVLGLHIPYTLPFDDTEIGFADIPLPDAKTHQFFAFRGAVHSNALFYEVWPFDLARDPTLIPDWVTVDDVRRSAEASSSAEGVTSSQVDVPATGVLENIAELSGAWSPITGYQARVPITMEQARMGAHWDILSVPPGLYTVAGYVFSPPYNGWKIRPGLVKIVEGGSDFPAAVIEPVNEFVFPHQGRRVRACLDTPAGTRLAAYFRVEAQAGATWLPWLAEREVATGALELCFNNPNSDVTGDIRLRFDLTAPDGATGSFVTPDKLTALSGSGRCVATESICCDFAGAPAADAPVAGAAAMPMPVASGDGAGPSSGGCAISAPASDPSALMLVLALWLSRRRVSRNDRHRGLGRRR
jgi:hypothetical protein